MTAEDKKTCFIAMPITTHDHEAERYGGDGDHWVHVMETIFVPAIRQAGFEPVRPAAVGSDMIHGHIVRELERADMVLCDLSGHNPNVFFELGVRTSLNKPVALVKDEHLGFPFDTGVLNTHPYSSSLSGWEVGKEVEALAQHILASERTCGGNNPMWRHFGLTIAADGPSADGSSSDARLELIFESMREMRIEMSELRRLNRSGLSVGDPIPKNIIMLRRFAAAAAEDVAQAIGSRVDGITDVADDSCLMHFTKPSAAVSLVDVANLARPVLGRRGFVLEMWDETETFNLLAVLK